MLLTLYDELSDLDQKIPREIKEDPDGIILDDSAWLKEMLDRYGPCFFKDLCKRRIRVKFFQLNLLAHGPFTDKVIDFTKGAGGFHIIYGHNEAGKSSALRGLRNMLYGIPQRSTDNFIHPYSLMWIGGTIQSARGDLMEFVRRKGIRGTLRLPDDGDIIEEYVLTGYLNGVDENLFTIMFGIDHCDLVRGGKEIINGKGNMGQLIFAAGSGVSRLHKV